MLLDLGNDLGGRPGPGTGDELGQQELLQAHASGRRPTPVGTVHVFRDPADLDRRHACILALGAGREAESYGTSMDTAAALDFLRQHHRAVLVTRRADGGLQTSPVAAAVDDAERVVVSTRAPSAKARNLARDPRAALCVVTDGWYGPWVHVEGTAEIVRLPAALPLLEDYYRRVAGEHPDWEDYRRAMRAEERVLLRIAPTRAAGA